MQKTQILLILSTIIIVTTCLGFLFYTVFVSGKFVNRVVVQDYRVIEFTGILKDFDGGCYVDAVCAAYINGYKIITNPGMVGFKIDHIGKNEASESDIGKRFKVRAFQIDQNTLTLVGDESLYVLEIEEDENEINIPLK